MTVRIPANRRIVVAPSYRAYKHYADHEADPRILHTFAADATAFVGRSFTEDQIVFLTDWTDHPRAKEIISQIELRLALNGASK